MKCIAVIPARGGSKGIPKKNVQPLAGKPLVAHSISNALKTPSINRVFVSTDDSEIAAVAQEYGAEVIWRPAEISNDTATSESALLHALDHLEQTESYVPDVMVFLQCTSPLTLADDIEGTIQALLTDQADSALSVSPFHYFLWGYDKEGEVMAINHNKYFRPRRQDRDPQYVETGAVYVMRVEGFKAVKHRFFGKIAMYEMPLERRLEIDDPVDLQIAEVLIHHQQSS
jgi:N-acylneuraminate cytidylyltransferase